MKLHYCYRMSIGLFLSGALAGCSESAPPSQDQVISNAGAGATGGTGAAGGSSGTSSAVAGGGSGPTLDPGALTAGTGGETVSCASQPNVDRDGDGFTPAQGDCNDCDAVVNPGAYDFPENKVDEDCSGKADDEVEDCESMLDIAGDDPWDGARALGLRR